MDLRARASAEQTRALVEQGRTSPQAFRAALFAVAPNERDTWLNVVFGLEELPEDGAALPRGCVPYLPCGVEVLLRLVDAVPLAGSDVFVDVGSGTGRAMTLVHLLTGAGAVGFEIQPELARAARELTARLRLSRVETLTGDAVELVGRAVTGSVYFLYCPFSGERLLRFLNALAPLGATRSICVCALDVPLPETSWLIPDPQRYRDLSIHRSSAAVPSRSSA